MGADGCTGSCSRNWTCGAAIDGDRVRGRGCTEGEDMGGDTREEETVGSDGCEVGTDEVRRNSERLGIGGRGALSVIGATTFLREVGGVAKRASRSR